MARLAYASPELRARVDQASKAWNARERSYPGWQNVRKGYLDEHGRFRETPDELTRDLQVALHECENHLKVRLAANELVAWGTPGTEAGTRIRVQSLSWDRLSFVYPKSQIRARGKPAIVYFDARVYVRDADEGTGRPPTERKPVSRGIEIALRDLIARSAHRSWRSMTEAQRAIRDEFDGRGSDKNALKIIADRFGGQIRAIVAENRQFGAEGNPSRKKQEKQE
jgi:hypothetical protein